MGAAGQEAGGQPGDDDPRRRPAFAPGGLERVRAHAGLQRAAVDQLFAALDASADCLELHCAPACGAGAVSSPASSSSFSRSEEHTSELQSLMRISYAVFCLKKKK